MTHIVIKNVGPIKNVEFDLNKINVFMGPQSSGKSTIAKILCHCQWVEKQCYSDLEHPIKYFQSGTEFYDSMVEYHKLGGYFDDKSRIIYIGDFISIDYSHQKRSPIIKLTNRKYTYPKIAYIPSERNIVAAIPNLKKYNDSNDVILYFMYDWFTSRSEIREQSFANILNRQLSYKFNNETDYVVDNGKELFLTNASSGVQSLIPLYLVLYYSLETIYKQKRPLSYEQKRSVDYLNHETDKMISDLVRDFVDIETIKKQLKQMGIDSRCKSAAALINKLENMQRTSYDRYVYYYTQLFVEEPEQNLFPSTQQRLMYWLLSLIQANKGRSNSLVLTTHSPYILFALNNCMMGGLVKDNIPEKERQSFVSQTAWIDPKKVSIYEIHDGSLQTIQDEDGIIEDNYLNKAYKENSAEYLSLLNYFEDEE